MSEQPKYPETMADFWRLPVLDLVVTGDFPLAPLCVEGAPYARDADGTLWETQILNGALHRVMVSG